ncbi:MAG TPA: hypothetical protein VG502_01745 [Flexivirga sp.]|uniref:channel accessory protein ArfC n=1 Tax=Flexivirga sp. TaxID=1962927 RepID=UPI002BCD993D|nr:hypothetical protein [Flexivirga sp.]HWC20999.1 hypothetical protein [Flexivirga sp.]
MGWLAGREWIWIVISFVLGLILTWFWLVQKVSARVPAGAAASGSGRGASKRTGGLGATASGIGAAGAAGAKGLKDKAGDAGESGISAAKRAVGRDEKDLDS